MTGIELREWRESRGLSRDALARYLEITVTTIYRWETNTKNSHKVPPFLKLALKQIEVELTKSGESPS